MLYTKLTQRAMQICFEAHRNQRDKGGMPYVFHPFHLAEQMETEDEICAALLHDVMEDTDWSFAQLAGEGFSPAVMQALLLLTHDDHTDYLDYVRRLSGNRIAARVKLADLRHNSMPGRLPAIGEKERKRMRKYLRAQAILTGGEADLEEMTLRMQVELQKEPQEQKLQKEQKEQIDQIDQEKKEECTGTAVLTTVLEMDGSVRKYTLRLQQDGQEREYQDLYCLLDDLEKSGFSPARAAAVICGKLPDLNRSF